ncbi:hypothetical protein AK812_SmicGene1802 [Symbiodinium microadriaticum]|uniref:Uncharacterized protein n=1 Tax=Symbiodinium microadriaticum TaxID=2951 RepID=A0A1Q9F385_SYMMI|nr:hypothetical protein AK812_SmicGene1802 [Symbiodinium microadriaticum]
MKAAEIAPPTLDYSFPRKEAASWFHAHFMRCGASLSKASLWTRILALLLLRVSAVRPSHEETAMRAMRFAGPEDQDDADANRSLFENLPGKLEPIVGKKLPLWQVEAGVMGGLVLLLPLGFITSAGDRDGENSLVFAALRLFVVLCRGSKTAAASALPAAGGEEEKGAEGATADEKLPIFSLVLSREWGNGLLGLL